MTADQIVTNFLAESTLTGYEWFKAFKSAAEAVKALGLELENSKVYCQNERIIDTKYNDMLLTIDDSLKPLYGKVDVYTDYEWGYSGLSLEKTTVAHYFYQDGGTLIISDKPIEDQLIIDMLIDIYNFTF